MMNFFTWPRCVACIAVIISSFAPCHSRGPQQADKDPDSSPAKTPISSPHLTIEQTANPKTYERPEILDSHQRQALSTRGQDSPSQLTLFLFASGVALFIALLGWSDQIRGLDRNPRELEHRFIKDTGIDERDFLSVVEPGSPDEQLETLSKLVNDGQLTTKVSVEALRTFATYIAQWTRLRRLSTLKYFLTISLTISLFAAGIGSLFIGSGGYFVEQLKAELMILLLPMTLMAVLLYIIIINSRTENAFVTMRLNSSRESLSNSQSAFMTEPTAIQREKIAEAKILPKTLPDDHQLPAETRDVLATFFAEIFYSLMVGMMKAKYVEPELRRIKEAAANMTREEMKRISGLAGKYYAAHSRPSSGKLSHGEVEKLKRDAIEFALASDSNET